MKIFINIGHQTEVKFSPDSTKELNGINKILKREDMLFNAIMDNLINHVKKVLETDAREEKRLIKADCKEKLKDIKNRIDID